MASETSPGVGVTYINRRPEWTDNIYGTGLSFVTGQTRVVPAEVAHSFLRHEDTFARAEVVQTQEAVEPAADDTDEQLAKGLAAQEAARKEEHDIMDLKDTVSRMDKRELTSYAKINFKQDLDQKAGVKDLRLALVQFIDRFGVV